MNAEYDIIVIGGGHAGCEAAHAAAKMGKRTLLITMNMSVIAQMSCNPAMGGQAKGQIVKEIDAIGGMSGIISDKSAIQFRMLNRSKGPAMWSPRTQNDRMLFAQYWRETLEHTENLDMWQDSVIELNLESLDGKQRISGVTTQLGISFKSKAVVLTTGTFMNGIIHIGDKQFGGGRMGEKASKGITEQLVSLGFESGRMKTGTPPRVDGRSIDYTKVEEQAGDDIVEPFSYLRQYIIPQQRSCFITYTNPLVHEILAEGFEKSPMFSGRIQGTGPRYCPSIEDKITRFAERERHQVFIEPEGWTTTETYINGFSTSLPLEVQQKAMAQIPGFEQAKMYRPGYAIEYDFLPPFQVKHTLETKEIEGLYHAGQINGTTGYEEAAAQGLMAGINAVQKLNHNEDIVLGRDQAYIGVLIDDLVTKSTTEPYRMFTSRAEHRLLLRQDNADIRLSPLGVKIGLADPARLDLVEQKLSVQREIASYVKKTSISPETINPVLEKLKSAPIKQKGKIEPILTRPNLNLHQIASVEQGLQELIGSFDEHLVESAEVEIKYKQYILKEEENAKKLQELEHLRIPEKFDYSKLQSLSTEGRQKLQHFTPTTLGQAKRISGVSPADVSILMVHLRK